MKFVKHTLSIVTAMLLFVVAMSCFGVKLLAESSASVAEHVLVKMGRSANYHDVHYVSNAKGPRQEYRVRIAYDGDEKSAMNFATNHLIALIAGARALDVRALDLTGNDDDPIARWALESVPASAWGGVYLDAMSSNTIMFQSGGALSPNNLRESAISRQMREIAANPERKTILVPSVSATEEHPHL